LTLSTNDTGRTFFATAQTEGGFPRFVIALTDGNNGYIRFQAPGSGTLIGQSEADYLRRSPLSPDLAGYNITQIGFRVNNFFDSYYAPDDLYLKTLDYSLDFYGAPVPEPGTWALLGLGSALLWSATRRRRK
jgi:PEP-CTERM motif